jgi:hypothetical protein
LDGSSKFVGIWIRTGSEKPLGPAKACHQAAPLTFSQDKIKSKLIMVIGFYFVSTVHLPTIPRLAIISAKLIRIEIYQLDIDLRR